MTFNITKIQPVKENNEPSPQSQEVIKLCTATRISYTHDQRIKLDFLREIFSVG